MSEEDALLSAIAAQPDEDMPRLAYADWLDEHGRHARAEFIRVQIEIARTGATLSREKLQQHAGIVFRSAELLEAHGREFLGPLTALPEVAVRGFDRGFVSAVHLSVHDFLKHAELVASTRPLPAVRVDAVIERLTEFLLCPHTACVSQVRAWSHRLDTLQLDYPDDLDMIDGIESLTRLEALDLHSCGINDLHLDLAYNFSVPALAELNLSYNQITDEGITNLLRTDLPKQLRLLELDVNAITDLGAQRLAEGWPTGAADRLEHLAIERNELTWLGQRVLRQRFGERVSC
jgi:uncharacterized protein (TIGR02996 family)